MKICKFNPRSFDGVFGYETPAIAFESNDDRDRAMRMIEAMEWLQMTNAALLYDGDTIRWKWQCDYVVGYMGNGEAIEAHELGDTPWDAILAAKQAAKGDGNG